MGMAFHWGAASETNRPGCFIFLDTPTTPLLIRPYEPTDLLPVWAQLEPVFRAGRTFPHDPVISEAVAQVAWVEQSQAVIVAVDSTGAVVGTYHLRPNSFALGAHVANAGYVVAQHYRRQGISGSGTWIPR